MLTKKAILRIFLLSIVLVLSAAIIFLTLKSLRENLVYFLSHSEIHESKDISFEKKIRIGGLVKEDSIKKKGTSINFIITDLKNEIFVSYKGLVPNLFSENTTTKFLSNRQYQRKLFQFIRLKLIPSFNAVATPFRIATHKLNSLKKPNV